MSAPIRIVVDGFAQAQRAPQGVIIPPLPVSMRGRHHVQMYTPAEVRKWQADFKHEAREQMKDRKPTEAAIEVQISIYLPVPKSMSAKRTKAALLGYLRPVTRPDCDNYCKAISDSLNGVVWLDDSQIVDLHVSKSYAEKPSVMVEVIELIQLNEVPEGTTHETGPLFAKES